MNLKTIITKMKKISTIIGISLFAAVFIYFLSAFISVQNRDVVLKNQFTQKISERTAFYDNMWKTISQKSQIALKNDSSFQNIVNIQVTGQKNGENVMFAWITQSNPSATFTEVSKLYQELSRTIEAKRDEFLEREKDLQSIKLQHDNLVDIFPGSLIMSILGRQKIDYKPITSDLTDNVMRTGKDNNVKLF